MMPCCHHVSPKAHHPSAQLNACALAWFLLAALLARPRRAADPYDLGLGGADAEQEHSSDANEPRA